MAVITIGSCLLKNQDNGEIEISTFSYPDEVVDESSFRQRLKESMAKYPQLVIFLESVCVTACSTSSGAYQVVAAGYHHVKTGSYATRVFCTPVSSPLSQAGELPKLRLLEQAAKLATPDFPLIRLASGEGYLSPR